MAYKPRSLSGATQKVRQLEWQIKQSDKLLEQWKQERILLAKLAANGPAFFNNLEVYAAEKLRDEILSSQGINPDGTFSKHR